jgi:hypothetical protein
MPLREPVALAKECTNDQANKGDAAQRNTFEIVFARASGLSGIQRIAGAIENWVMKVLKRVVHDSNWMI